MQVGGIHLVRHKQIRQTCNMLGGKGKLGSPQLAVGLCVVYAPVRHEVLGQTRASAAHGILSVPLANWLIREDVYEANHRRGRRGEDVP